MYTMYTENLYSFISFVHSKVPFKMVSLVYSPQSSFCWWILGKSLAWNTTQFPPTTPPHIWRWRSNMPPNQAADRPATSCGASGCSGWENWEKVQMPHVNLSWLTELQEFKSSQMLWIPKLFTRNFKKYQVLTGHGLPENLVPQRYSPGLLRRHTSHLSHLLQQSHCHLL